MLQSTIPAKLMTWLTYESVMTERLKNLTGDAQVIVVKQQHEACSLWDKEYLHIHETQVVHRDVLVSSHQKPYWFARTIIPSLSFHANNEFFSRLQQESLGKMIFDNPNVKRLSLTFYSINQQSSECQWHNIVQINASDNLLWARRSEFIIKNRFMFYLIEILLPNLLEVNA